jgi:hypothetical protein
VVIVGKLLAYAGIMMGLPGTNMPAHDMEDLRARFKRGVIPGQEITVAQVVVLKHFLGVAVPALTFNQLADCLDSTPSHLHVVCSAGLRRLGIEITPSKFKERLKEGRTSDHRVLETIIMAQAKRTGESK